MNQHSGGRGMMGMIEAVWRYPVKSMGGEEIPEATVGERGLAGDRIYAVVDEETGHVASAKNPRKWAPLIACRAALTGSPAPGGARVRVTLPDGGEVESDDPAVHRVLSELLGRAVRLTAHPPLRAVREADRSPLDDLEAGTVREEPLALAAPAGTFFDVAPLHLLTTQTLEELAERAPGTRFDPRRFRPNLVIRAAGRERGFPENEWIGTALVLGSGLRLHVIDPSPRCVATTLAQGDLPRDPAVLRTVARANSAASATLAPGVVFPGVAGVYARVEGAGQVRRGDVATLG